MYEKELAQLKTAVADIVRNTGDAPAGAVQKLQTLKAQFGDLAGSDSPEYYDGCAMIHEAVGDIWLRAKKPADAEIAYKEMLRLAGKLYQLDKERYDLRMGISYYKLAGFYRGALQCHVVLPVPRKLDDKQLPLWQMTESLYKSAVACTMEHAKQGKLQHVDLHTSALHELAVLCAAVGHHQIALRIAKDGIQLEKAVYEKLDDKAHSLRLAGRMSALASIATLLHDRRLAADTLEDAIFVLEEHFADDPVNFGMALGRNHLTLAGCYSQLEEEKANADHTFEKGLQLMTKANDDANGKFNADLITAHMVLGDHYRVTNREVPSKAHYRQAMKSATEMYQKTRHPIFQNFMKHLKKYV